LHKIGAAFSCKYSVACGKWQVKAALAVAAAAAAAGGIFIFMVCSF